MNHYLTTTTAQFSSCFQKGARIALALHFWYRKLGLISYLSNAYLKQSQITTVCLLVFEFLMVLVISYFVLTGYLYCFGLTTLIEKSFYQRHTTKHLMGSGCNEVQKQFLRFQKKFREIKGICWKKKQNKIKQSNHNQ